MGALFDELYARTLGKVFKPGSRGDLIAQTGFDLAERAPNPLDFPGAVADAGVRNTQAIADGLREGFDYLRAVPGESRHPAYAPVAAEASASGPANPFPNLRPDPGPPKPKPILPNLGPQADAPQATEETHDSFFAEAAKPGRVSDPEYAGLRAGAFQASPGFVSDGSVASFLLNDQARRLLAGSAEGEGFLAEKRREMDQKVRGGSHDPAVRDLHARLLTTATERAMPAGSESSMQFKNKDTDSWLNAEQGNDWNRDGRGELGRRTMGEEQSFLDRYRLEQAENGDRIGAAIAPQRDRMESASYIEQEYQKGIADLNAKALPPEEKERRRAALDERRRTLLRSINSLPPDPKYPDLGQAD
jgi:hypothetical protein